MYYLNENKSLEAYLIILTEKYGKYGMIKKQYFLIYGCFGFI